MTEAEFINSMRHVFVQWLAHKGVLAEYLEKNCTNTNITGNAGYADNPIDFLNSLQWTRYLQEYTNYGTWNGLHGEWRSISSVVWDRWRCGEFS